MKKKLRKLTSVVMICTLSISSTLIAYASNENSTTEIQQLIEEVAGTNDVVVDTYKTKDNIAVADGENSIIKVPKNGSYSIELNTAYEDEESFSINLPLEAKDATAKINENGTIVYESDDTSSTIGVQTLNNGVLEGVRSLITINDSNASKEYTYTFNLEEGTKLMSASEYLGNEYDTGEVFVVDSENIIIGIVDAPWAYDAHGNSVTTYYEINGTNVLKQVIEFTKDSAFPIVADPSVWQVTKCVAAVSWAIGSTVFAAAKLVKLKKYIKALGGLKEAVTLALACSTNAERLEAGGTTLVNFCAIIFGVDSIVDECGFIVD